MKVTYDLEVDVLSILFNNEQIEESETIRPGVGLDYDKDDNSLEWRSYTRLNGSKTLDRWNMRSLASSNFDK